MAPVLPLLSFLVAGTTAAVGIANQEDQADKARAAAKEQADQQTAYITEAKAKTAETEKLQGESQVRQAATQERRQRRALAGSTRSTVLTSPLGLNTEPAGGRKTLLGQ